MVDKALLLLRDELINYISLAMDPVPDVILENIGRLETQNDDVLNRKVVITLVNIEEESTLKNGRNVFNSGLDTTAAYYNLPIHLNLYVLFTANFPDEPNTDFRYRYALSCISNIIRFFQGRTVFSAGSATTPAISDPRDEETLKIRFTMELYTLTFEQVNHLWGSLGGRQIPFVMYKLRLVAISDRRLLREVPLIEEIETIVTPVINKH